MAFFNSIYKALTGRDVEALLQKLSEREAEISKLQTQIESQTATIESQAATIKYQKAILESQDSTITSHTATITAQSDKIEKLNKNLKESSDNLDSVKEQLDEEHTSNKTLTLKVSHFQSRISKLKKDLEDEQTSKSAVEERLNETQVELSNANKQISEYSLQIETTQNSLKEIEDKFVQQTNLLQQEKEKYATAEQLLSKAESDSKELNSELSNTKEKISELTAQLQQTQNENEEARTENISLRKQLQELSEKIVLQENEKDKIETADDKAHETTDKDIDTEEDDEDAEDEIAEDVNEIETEEDEEEEKQEEETAEYEIDWDNKELETLDVEQDNILSDSTLSITKVWDVRNKKEIDAKQFFSLPEGEIMSMRRELQLAITTDNPYWVCPVCGQMIKISGKRTARGKALFFSHLHDSEDCPIKTNTGLTKRMIEARKYALVQESERHHRLKTSIANFLEETNSKSKGVSDVQIEKRVTTDLPFMNWRCPDVQAMYHGMHLVFELQLSTTFISTIVERDLFYRLNNYFIIWVFNFEENKEYMDLTNLMCKDIYYANKRNIFVFDKDAQAESLRRKELVLKCNWLDADNTWHYGPTDGDGNGIFIAIDQLNFDTKNNKPYYYDAEKEYFLQNKDVLLLRAKQELDLKAILEGLERREQQKKERKALREAKKEIEKLSIVVANDKTTNEESFQNTIASTQEGNKSQVTINANGHEYVDLGLPSGTLWATCNVGATKPEEYGDYFAWGEVQPKEEYSWETYKWCNGSYNKLTKYCNDIRGNIIVLDPEDDVAHVNWGGDWRMPTNGEQYELYKNCIWIWINQNGVEGHKVTSKINGNSIFLPAAGYRNYSDLNDAGSYGCYWDSSLYSGNSYYAYELYFDSSKVGWIGYNRYYGRSVRPVLRVEFTLRFVPNGGQGEMPIVVKPFNQAFTLPTCTIKRDGYEFIGWNTQPDGTGEKYEDGDTIYLSTNTALYAQWKEIPTKENMHNGHEYVDLGLPSGTLWATCNVGANSPEEYGDYFAWGEVEPSGDKYKEYKWFDDEERVIKYCNDKVSRYVDRIKELEFLDDAANFNWGGKWCMPNKKEFEELLECCIWNEVNKNGINGFEVISKTNGKSIFFIRRDYWSASVSLNNEYTAYELLLCSRRVHLYSAERVSRNAIRPIMRNEYTLSFDANGGEGDMLPIVKEPNEFFRIPISAFNRFGFLFVGWNTKSNGTGITYLEEQEFNLSMNVELYAQWEEDTNIPNVHNGHEYVDLGLPSGTLWATCNIGATKPEENGDYFTWGSIYPTRKQIKRYKRIMPTSSLGCYFYGYCVDPMYGKVDNKTSLDLCDDAAFRWWGGTWSTPSALEQKELYNNCLWEREVIDGCIGYKAISIINGNSIFFPAAGFYDEDKRWYADGLRGEYWSKSICLERCKNAIFMTVCSRPSLANDKGNRCESRTIRPIMHIGLTLKFDSNGGQGEMISYTRLKNHIFRLPFNEFIMKECVFIEWNTNIDGSGDKYLEGQDICLTENITLYAQWKKIY